MKSISGLFLALALTATSPLIMAAGDDAQTMKHDHTDGVTHSVEFRGMPVGIRNG